MELPETAPTANRGLSLSRAVMKKMVSGAVLSQAMTSPPTMEASYFLPKISPPSPTHHDATTSRANVVTPTNIV
jgi:hypothetical protein